MASTFTFDPNFEGRITGLCMWDVALLQENLEELAKPELPFAVRPQCIVFYEKEAL